MQHLRETKQKNCSLKSEEKIDENKERKNESE
jgi:hypothetical protein